MDKAEIRRFLQAEIDSIGMRISAMGAALVAIDHAGQGIPSDEVASAAGAVLNMRTPPKDSIVEVPAEFVVQAKRVAGYVLQKDDQKGPNAISAENQSEDTSGYTDEEKNERARQMRSGAFQFEWPEEAIKAITEHNTTDKDGSITNPVPLNDAKG